MKRLCLAALLLGLSLSASAGLIESALDILLRSLRSFSGAEVLKYSLHYDLQGQRSGSGEDWVSWNFSGPVRVATVDAADAQWQGEGPVVGQVVGWNIRLRVDRTSVGLPPNTLTDLGSTRLRLELADGSVLTELLDDPATPLTETDIPLQGRLLFELGPIPGGSGPFPVRYRATGCMGVQGSGSGALAGRRGALCISGAVGFPKRPADFAELRGFDRAEAISGFTLVLH
ncbi:hypothetical protein [Solimonas sp. SE-A11]|uniref:hypothetical protein n=1 Tax=Solimonas sp. SE-A11 TaxID=3054954 RepID=UPI00259CAD28|nr:hypothetical protein [Solimonas sp. SE-A11]MDM4771763.1 hypothetical protein [Solimonas sp. SE-A11]